MDEVIFLISLNLGPAAGPVQAITIALQLPIIETRVTILLGLARADVDGEDERVCKSSSDFPEFLCFLVQSAKQMRYGWLTRARVYFGNNVFGTKPPTERLRSKCFIISI